MPAVFVRDAATIFARRLIDALSAGSWLREKTNPDEPHAIAHFCRIFSGLTSLQSCIEYGSFGPAALLSGRQN